MSGSNKIGALVRELRAPRRDGKLDALVRELHSREGRGGGYELATAEAVVERVHQVAEQGPTAFPAGDTVGGTKSHFGTPSVEETRTWGNTYGFQFDGTQDVPVQLDSPQLVHVLRRRPTSYNVLTIVTFTNGWTNEVAGNWTVSLGITIGVGQVQDQIINLVTPGASLAVGLQVTNLQVVAAHAIQANARLTGTPQFSGVKAVRVTMLAAPFFE